MIQGWELCTVGTVVSEKPKSMETQVSSVVLCLNFLTEMGIVVNTCKAWRSP